MGLTIYPTSNMGYPRTIVGIVRDYENKTATASETLSRLGGILPPRMTRVTTSKGTGVEISFGTPCLVRCVMM